MHKQGGQVMMMCTGFLWEEAWASRSAATTLVARRSTLSSIVSLFFVIASLLCLLFVYRLSSKAWTSQFAATTSALRSIPSSII